MCQFSLLLTWLSALQENLAGDFKKDTANFVKKLFPAFAFPPPKCETLEFH